MATLFCCANVQPFRPTRLDHETKFTSFHGWSRFPRCISPYHSTDGTEAQSVTPESTWLYAVQLVQQVNYGPLESKRYFVPKSNSESDGNFLEILENDLIDANFIKVNSYKNFRCLVHNKFFEVNLYQKDPINKHHWRVNIARPSEQIDLAPKKGSSNTDSKLAEGTRMDSSQTASITDVKPTHTELEELEEKPLAAGDMSRSPSTLVRPTLTLPAPYKPTFTDRDKAHLSDDQYDDFDRHESTYDSEESVKDFTACSLECGYCGHCDY